MNEKRREKNCAAEFVISLRALKIEKAHSRGGGQNSIEEEWKTLNAMLHL